MRSRLVFSRVHALCTTPLGTRDRDFAYNFSFVLLLDGTSQIFSNGGKKQERLRLRLRFMAGNNSRQSDAQLRRTIRKKDHSGEMFFHFFPLFSISSRFTRVALPLLSSSLHSLSRHSSSRTRSQSFSRKQFSTFCVPLNKGKLV